MGIMASWGSKRFQISNSQITPLQDLTTSLTLKEDSENDTSGTQPTNTRGRNLRPISFKVTYLAAAGADPRKEIEEWEELLGEKYPLYIGGQRFGAEKMKLTEVSTSDILLTNSGGFIRATLSIKLEEYSEGKTSALTSSTTASGSTGSTSIKAEIEGTVAAMNATASATDKASKKNAR